VRDNARAAAEDAARQLAAGAEGLTRAAATLQTCVAQQATSSIGPWTQCYVGQASSCTVTGLTSGTQYWFQVRAIGAAGPSAWSDPTTKRAT
jgi:hypothetical protein